MNCRSILWDVDAVHERIRILRNIAEKNRSAAWRMNLLFKKSVERLQQFPAFGRPGLVKGTRDLSVHKNYRIVYTIEDEYLEVLAIDHVKRQSAFAS